MSAEPAPAEILQSLVGTWRGQGQVWLPTRPATDYDEEIRFSPRNDTTIEYWQRATHSVDGSPSHAEVGFWRVTADGTLEISVAIGGAVEVSEGTIAADLIELASSGVVRASTSRRFAGTARHYRLKPDRITYEVELATVDHPLSGHLRGELRRVS
jgi:hypothetical protein